MITQESALYFVNFLHCLCSHLACLLNISNPTPLLTISQATDYPVHGLVSDISQVANTLRTHPDELALHPCSFGSKVQRNAAIGGHNHIKDAVSNGFAGFHHGSYYAALAIEAHYVIASRADTAQLHLIKGITLLEVLYGIPGGKEVIADKGNHRLVLLYRRPPSRSVGRGEIF